MKNSFGQHTSAQHPRQLKPTSCPGGRTSTRYMKRCSWGSGEEEARQLIWGLYGERSAHPWRGDQCPLVGSGVRGGKRGDQAATWLPLSLADSDLPLGKLAPRPPPPPLPCHHLPCGTEPHLFTRLTTSPDGSTCVSPDSRL